MSSTADALNFIRSLVTTAYLPHFSLSLQDLSKLNVAELTPLTPEVISRQATINIGEPQGAFSSHFPDGSRTATSGKTSGKGCLGLVAFWADQTALFFP